MNPNAIRVEPVDKNAISLALREVNDAPEEASWKFELETYSDIVRTGVSGTGSSFTLGKAGEVLLKHQIKVTLKYAKGELQEELETVTETKNGTSKVTSLHTLGPAPKGIRPAQLVHPIEGGALKGRADEETVLLSSPAAKKAVYRVSIVPDYGSLPRVKADAKKQG